MRSVILAMLVLSIPSILPAETVWVPNELDTPFVVGHWSIDTGDINADGAMDIISTSGQHGVLAWWQNNGDGSEWIDHLVSTSFDIGWNIYAVDIDVDGDLDLAGTVDEPNTQLRWWENIDGDGLSWVEHIAIPANLGNTTPFSLADIDGDGDLDALNSNSDLTGIVWYENSDDGLTWDLHTLDPSFPITGTMHLYGGDLDNDTHMDVICTSQSGDLVVWWRNVNGDGIEWSESIAVGRIDGPYAADIDDLDGDGDQDIACVAFSETNEGRILWWENDGTGNFDLLIISTQRPAPETVLAEDFDADGDLDLLVGSRATGVAWWENGNGEAHFTTRYEIDPFIDGIHNSYSTEDFNGDGDIDVAGSQWVSSRVVWWDHVTTFGTLNLTRTSSPVIPATGGLVIYDASLVTFLPDPQIGLGYAGEVTFPNGTRVGPFNNIVFNLPPFFSTTVTGIELVIPGFVPDGNYLYTGRVHFRPGPQISDSFSFIKSASVPDAEVVQHWESRGNLFEAGEGQSSSLPAEFSLSPAYPNPFNPTTTFSVNLPSAGELIVSVLNVTGQQVAELACGQFRSGTHTLIFDASEMASGLYFIHATVPGLFDETQKVMLVR
jgi:FG-GAP-like repeat/Secretion system C-terminal sorting domain